MNIFEKIAQEENPEPFTKGVLHTKNIFERIEKEEESSIWGRAKSLSGDAYNSLIRNNVEDIPITPAQPKSLGPLSRTLGVLTQAEKQNFERFKKTLQAGNEREFSLSGVVKQGVRAAGQGVADIGRTLMAVEQVGGPEYDWWQNPSSQDMGLWVDRLSKIKEIEGQVALNPERIREERKRHAEEKHLMTLDVTKQFVDAFPELLQGSTGLTEDVVVGMARFLPSMAISAVSPVAGTAMVFSQITGMKYEEFTKQGVDKEHALKSALLSSIAQTPLEMAGNLLQIGALKNVAKTILKGDKGKLAATFVESLIKGIVGEGTEEFLQQYPDELSNIYAANPKATAGEITEEFLRRKGEITKSAGKAAIVGGIGGGALAGIGGMAAGTSFALESYKIKKKTPKKPEPTKKPQKTTETLKDYDARLKREAKDVPSIPEGFVMGPDGKPIVDPKLVKDIPEEKDWFDTVLEEEQKEAADAVKVGKKPEGDVGEHPGTGTVGKAAIPGSGDSVEQGGKVAKEEVVEEVKPPHEMSDEEFNIYSDKIVDEKNALKDKRNEVKTQMIIEGKSLKDIPLEIRQESRDSLEFAMSALTLPSVDLNNITEGIKIAIKNGRLDIARALVERTIRYAKNSNTTPGVSKDSPKYDAILETLKKNKEKAISEAERIKRLYFLNSGEEYGKVVTTKEEIKKEVVPEKQPHEMNTEEFTEYIRKTQPKNEGVADTLREGIVKKAQAEGKVVPADVLAEVFPEVQPKKPPAVPEKTDGALEGKAGEVPVKVKGVVADGVKVATEPKVAYEKARSLGYEELLVHESNEADLKGITKRDDAFKKFDGIFTSRGWNGKYGNGEFEHHFVVRPDKIARNGDIDFDYDKTIDFLKKEYPEIDDATLDILYDLTAMDKSVWDSDVNPLEQYGFDDMGNASWELQNIRGKIAVLNGFDAVEVRDELGTSVFLPYGTKAKNLNDPLFQIKPATPAKPILPFGKQKRPSETEIEATQKHRVEIISRGFPQQATFAGETVTVRGVPQTGQKGEELGTTLEELNKKGGQLSIKKADGSTAIVLDKSIQLTQPEAEIQPISGKTIPEVGTEKIAVYHAKTKGEFTGKPSVDIGSDADIMGKGFYFSDDTDYITQNYGDPEPYTIEGRFASTEQWKAVLKKYEKNTITEQRKLAREELKSEGYDGVIQKEEKRSVGVVWSQKALGEFSDLNTQIATLSNQGKDAEEIATELGISKKKVMGIMMGDFFGEKPKGRPAAIARKAKAKTIPEVGGEKERFQESYVKTLKDDKVTQNLVKSRVKGFGEVLKRNLTEEQTFDLMVEMMQIGKEQGNMSLIGDSTPTQPEWLVAEAWKNVSGEDIYSEEKPKGKPAIVARKAKTKPPKNIRQAIQQEGGLHFQDFPSDANLETADKMALSRKAGLPMDEMKRRLVSQGWITEDENLLDSLNSKGFLNRKSLQEQGGIITKDMEHEVEEPPGGADNYVEVKAGDLPMGKKLTLLTGDNVNGYDTYEVLEKDDLSVLMKDGTTINIDPTEKVQVFKGDLEKAEVSEKRIAQIVPHPDGDGYAVKLGKGFVSGGAGAAGGGTIGKWATVDEARAKGTSHLNLKKWEVKTPAEPAAKQGKEPVNIEKSNQSVERAKKLHRASYGLKPKNSLQRLLEAKQILDDIEYPKDRELYTENERLIGNRKRDLGIIPDVPAKQSTIDVAPEIFEPPPAVVPKRAKSEKLAAKDLIKEERPAPRDQKKLFEPNQQDLFGKKEAKEPWQMDESLWLREYEKEHHFTPAPGSHEEYVRQALKEGKNVPAEVLKAYPELAKDIPQYSTQQKAVDTESKEFKDWFSGSKVVDSDGKPLVVYHGTDQIISEFRQEKMGFNTRAQSARGGFFFTNNPIAANLYPVYPNDIFNQRKVGATMKDAHAAMRGEKHPSEVFHNPLFKAEKNVVDIESEIEKIYGNIDKINQAISDMAEKDRLFIKLKDYQYPTVEAKRYDSDGLKEYDKYVSEYTDEEISLANRLSAALEDAKHWRYVAKWSQQNLSGASGDEAWNGKDAQVELTPNIMPLYLSLENPLIYNQATPYRDITFAELIKNARGADHDGLIIRNTKDPLPMDVYVAFSPTQIKSAISNTGAFSKSDPRIQYATKKPYIDFGGKDNALYPHEKRSDILHDNRANETRKLQKLLSDHGHRGTSGIKAVGPSGRERQAITKIAKKLGVNAVFFQASNPNIGFNGVVFPENPNTVYINTDSTTPFLVVIGHEITHTLEKNHPDLYKQYMDLMANNTLKFDDYLNGLNILREDFGMPTVSPLEAYKELLADFAGDQFTNPEFYEALHAADPSFAKRFVNILKRVLTKIAHAAKSVFGTEKYIKDIKQGQEVLSVVLKEYASRESGGKSKAIREGMPLFQVQAFHGSPHVVDKFSTDKIGTGEGVQAFGWGLYFTELEDIARHYAGSNIGTESIFKYDGVELTHPSLDNRSENLAKWGIASLIKKGRSPNVAKTQEAAFLERNIRDGFIESQKILDALKDIDPSKIQIITTGRNLYKVTLHKGKEPGDYVWLDWDKALPDAQQKEIGRHIDKEYSPGEFKDKIRSAIRKDDNFVVTINGETTAGFQSLVEANSFLQKNDKGNPKYKWEVSAKQGEIGRRIYRRLSNVLGSDKQASLFLLRAGIDGIRYPAGSLSGMKDTGAKNYVVFDENAVTIESHAQYSTKQKESAAMQAESQLDAFRRKFQDQYLPLKRTEEFLESQGSEIGDRSPYLLEELHTSKAQAKLEELEDRLIRPFMEDLRKSKVSVEEMEQYRYAEHAPERNEYIQSINEDFEEGGSGMTDEEAQEILDDFAAEGKIEDLKRLDKWIDKIVAFQKGVIRVVGLETPDIVDAWGRYDKYIPLKGVSDENAINTFFGRKKGLGVKKSGTKRALGRQSRATDLLANLFAQTAQTVQQAEIAQIGQAFLSMVEANPNAEMWNVYKPGDKLPTKRAYVRGKVVEVPDPMWTNRGDVFPVTREGEIYYIEIKNKQLAGALNRLNQPEQGSIIQALGHLNRYLSVINTMLNLEFVITNFERDIQTAMTNLAGEQSLKLAKDTLKGVPSAMKGIHNSLRGDKKSEMAGWYKRFKFAGGQVGFMDLQSVEKKIKEIKKMSSVKRNPVTEALRYTSILGNIIGDYNTIVENAVRLSAFKTAVGAGMSEPRAASLAKNLTVNFNRKGEYGVAMNSMYLFFNAGIQGSTRIIQALGHKNVRRIVYAVTATSIALAEMSRLSGGEDDDGKDKWDKINPYLKQTNYIYLREDGSLVKIKLPYGYNVFVALGYAINDSWHYFASDKIKGMSPAAAASFMAIAAIDAFNPIGGSESLIKLISPTISDPFVDVAVNENFMGIPIKPENLQFGPKKPESELYWSSVRPISKNIAQKINELTGGDKVEPGVIDISPEVLDYFWDYATGGAGRFFADTAGTAVSLAKGEEQKTNRIPFVRKVIQDPNEYFDLQEFRKNSDKAIAYYNSEKGIASSKDRIAYEKRHPEIKLHNQAKVYQKEMSRLRNAQREAEGKKEEKRAKEFETRMRKTAMEFNKKFYDITIKKQAR